MNVQPNWLKQQSLRRVLNILSDAGYPSLLVGGCVRDAVLGIEAADIDIATPATPDLIPGIFEGTGVSLTPTGVDHGTWTVVCHGDSYEITTFRRDVETDGRRATVAWADNIFDDAERRDFTMNALYMDKFGVIIDPTGMGLVDLNARRIRFVGDADERCREDYLRILRLFRFHAKYGKGRMDAEAFNAAERHATGLYGVSGERKWAELKKLLSVHDPLDALYEMKCSGVMQHILPEHASPQNVADVLLVERAGDLSPRWLARYVALMGYREVDIPFPCSREERNAVWKVSSTYMLATIPAHAAFRLKDPAMALDCAVLSRAFQRTGWFGIEHESIHRGLNTPLPVTAQDFMHFGVEPGPKLGQCLREAENAFISSDLLATKDELMNLVKARVFA